jgi:hypothetical protein
MQIKARLTCVFLLASCPLAGADEPKTAVAASERRAVAGPQYEAGLLKRFVFGSGYRRVWNAPIRVEVLDLGSFSGGLVVDEKSGGKQTKGLKFDGADGRKWRFRSVDKDPTPVLPKSVQHSFVAGIARDQTSASLPAGVLVVDALSAAAQIPYVAHKLVMLADDPRLGQFQAEFAGVLGTIEESPRFERPVTPGFEGFDRALDTKELEELLDADGSQGIDARAFLKARLLDLLIGDYDRHSDQWHWARSVQTGRWVPVPRDRDLAFVKFDGLMMSVVRLEQPRLVEFEAAYSNLVGLTWQARFLDRRHLSSLERPVWQEVASELHGQLTDAVIDDAVRRLPTSYYAVAGEDLAERLKRRRDELPGVAGRFYELLAREAEVYGTDQADSVQLSYLADGSVDVALSGPGGPYFRRTFRSDETHEVRLFLQDGADRVLSERGDGGRIRVRVVGGDGNDVVDDSAGGAVRVYDAAGDVVKEGPGTWSSEKPYTRPEDRAGQPTRDWGTWTRRLPSLQAGADYGVLLGAAVLRTGYGFRKDPHANLHVLKAGYATGLQAPSVEYAFESRAEQSRNRVGLLAGVSPLDVVHFYGFGNETTESPNSQFHDLDQTRYFLALCYRLRTSLFGADVGPVLKYGETNLNRFSLIALRQPYGVDNYGQVGWRVAIGTGVRDDRMIHAKSAGLSAEGTYYPSVWSVDDAFGSVRAQATTVLTSGLPLKPALAFRVGGQKVFGRYPYHEAASIGGSDSVRGLPTHRFLGDASLHGSGELRFVLRERDDRLIGRFGVFGLFDAGRVFLEGESSDRWHSAVGGGLWFSVVEPKYLVTLAAARSEARVRLYLQGGFAF